MKIKMIVSIIAIVISSISMAEAGQNHRKYDRHYGSSHHANNGHHYRKNHHRSHWKRKRHARHHYREQRHYRKHHYNRHERSHRYNTRWKHTYNTPRISSSHRVIVRSHRRTSSALPVVAGGLIGSVIANDASHGDPAATFGGAVFGALVGRALTHH